MPIDDFQRLILNSQEHLKPFAFNFTKCNESAKDLIQDTLLLAWKNQHKYRIGTNIRAWLFTIMRNAFINKYRSNKLRGNIQRQNAIAITGNTLLHTNPNQANYNLEKDCLMKSLLQLPDLFKKPLELYASGYKCWEIALTLSESEGTIKSRIHFGRKLLKEELKRRGW
jgi:RNA polymerase sigma factor (sigma-70 family)